MVNVLTLCVLIYWIYSGISQISDSEVLGLEYIYNYTNGSFWAYSGNGNEWNFIVDPVSPCSDNWDGVVCDCVGNANCTVWGLELSQFNMVGELPENISLLENMRYLDMSGNSLSGNIPYTIGCLLRLIHVDFSRNFLDGTLPSQLWSLTDLLLLDFGSNFLSGSLSSQISNLQELGDLYLDDNLFDGQLPLSLSDLKSLKYLSVSANLFSGAINYDFTKANLTSMACDTNYFTGSLPINSVNSSVNLQVFEANSNMFTGILEADALQYLPLMTYFDASSNRLDGRIPTVIGSWDRLVSLYLNANLFFDDIPSSLCAISGLEYLGLGSNALTGSIPQNLSLNLVYLVLSSNFLTGTIPNTVGNCMLLEGLSLDLNFLTGSIPYSICNLSKLQDLYLFNNRLTRRIPHDIGNLSSIVNFGIDNNFIIGSIPDSISAFSNLLIFSVNQNRITGTLPSGLCNAVSVQALYLSFNRLEGSFPECLGFLGSLSDLEVNNNAMSGSLPDSFGFLGSLEIFLINNNKFSGTLPTTISALVNIQDFHVENNKFSGPIAAIKGELIHMQYFYFYENSFTGTLPTIMGLWINLQFIAGNNNEITGLIPSELGNLKSLILLGLEYNKLSGTIPSSLGSILGLQSLNLNNNIFSNKIPSAIGELKLLLNALLNNNRLSGTVPESFTKLARIEVLQVSYNFLSGDVTKSLGYSQFLRSLDISDNNFSGKLPTLAFQSASLEHYIASKNCFEGPIPSSVCNAVGLRNFQISGLTSGNSCSKRFFISNLIYFSSYIEGEVPGCIYSMPNLIAFYASGNGLKGRLKAVPGNSTLQNISLSHNRLFGSIPTSIQEYDRFALLDLSFNRIEGTINNLGGFVVSTYVNITVVELNDFKIHYYLPKSLYLESNRLSGDIPGAFTSTNISLNILEGNLFQCHQTQSNLPQNDPAHDKYVCGSSELDSFVYVYLGLTVIGGIFFGFFLYRLSTISRSTKKKYYPELFTWAFQYLFWGGMVLVDCKGVILLSKELTKFRTLCGYVVVFIIVICLPVFVSLKEAYSAYSHEYGWVISLGFLDGLAPAIVIGILFSLLMVFCACGLYKLEVMSVFSQSSRIALSSFHSSRSMRAARILLIILHISLVVLANVAYVYVALTQHNVVRLVITVLLVAFKLTWGQFILNLLDAWNASISTLVYALMFNNVVGPLLATLAVDGSCFQYIFVPPPSIFSSYYIAQCVAYISNNYCVEVLVAAYETVLNPPFIYSYNCGSSLLQNYIPIFLLMYSISGVILPILRLVVLIIFLDSDKVRNKNSRQYLWWVYLKENVDILSLLTGRIISPLVLPLDLGKEYREDRRTESKVTLVTAIGDQFSRNFYRIKFLCLNCTVSFALLVSFGLAYPPFAVIIWLQIIFSTILVQVAIHKHYLQMQSNNDPSAMERWSTSLLQECKQARNILFGFVMNFLSVGSVFIFIFMCDMEENIVGGVVILLLAFLLRLFIVNSDYLLSKFRKQNIEFRVTEIPTKNQLHVIDEEVEMQ